jgi:selenocysteine lyase/cysteine desulfurase
MTHFATIALHSNNVVHIVLAGSPDGALFEEEFLRPLDALLANKNRFALVIDAQNVTGVSMPVAWAMIKWMRANRSLIKTYLRASGVVIVNDAVKAIMEFVLSVQPASAPMTISTATQDAWNFVASYHN